MKKNISLFLFSLFIIIMVNQMNAQEILDLSGKKISAYIVTETLESFEKLKINESVLLKTDNYAAIKHDLQAWSRMTGNRVTLKDSSANNLTLEITKTSEKILRGKVFSIVVSEKGMLELLSPIGLSIAAAVSGYEVNIYFQGPAVKVLEKGFKEKLPGFNAVFSRFARNGLSKIGHSPAQEKLKILEKYGATFYVCQPSMERFGAQEENFAFSNTIICEYLTFLEVIERSDITYFLQ